MKRLFTLFLLFALTCAGWGQLQMDRINPAAVNFVYYVDGRAYTTIQAAITAAGTTGAVIIPPKYAGVDTYTNPNGILILDYRNGTLAIGTGGKVAVAGSITAAGLTASGTSLTTLGQTTVASLPSAASNPGAMILVTDSTAVASEGQTCVGSSTNKAVAISNGSSWKCF